MKWKLLVVTLATCLCAPASLLGCKDNDPEEPEIEETVGDEAEEAADETGEAVEETGDETGDAIDEAEDEIDQEM